MTEQKHKYTTAEIEQKILGILIGSQTARHRKLSQIKRDDFAQSQNQIIFQAIVDLSTDVAKNFDLTLLSNYLKKQKKLSNKDIDLYLTELVEDFVSDQFLDQYLKILIDHSTIRQIQQKLKDWEKTLNTKNTQPNKLLNNIDLQVKKLIDFHTRHQGMLKPLNTIVQEVVDEWKTFQNTRHKNTCTTGFSNLDNKIHGFQKGDLIILAARPSMGKTALALNIAVSNSHNYQGKDNQGDVIIFSLEMSSYQLVQRILSSHLPKVNLRYLKKDDYQEVDRFSEKLSDTNVYVDTSMAIDVHSIGFKLRSWVQKRKIRLVIIDYLQLLKPVLAEKFDNRNLEIAHWTRILKEIARELNVPILCISQLSRYVDKRDDKRPVLSDLRDSGSIEQDADLVLFLYREVYYQKKNPDQSQNVAKTKAEPSKAEVIVAKHRNGPTGSIELLFVPSEVTFYEGDVK